MSSLQMWTPEEVVTVEVIRVVACRGAGVENNPVRRVTQYWSHDGKLLAENDPVAIQNNPMADPRLEP